MSNSPKGILAFDLDGTITPRNQKVITPPNLVALLNSIGKLGYFSILISGKPVSYIEQIAKDNQLDDYGLIGENAGSYKEKDSSEVKVFGPGLEQINKLKNFIDAHGKDVTSIQLDANYYQVVIDPGDVSILTIFTDPSHVSHRWRFRHDIQANELYSKLKELILKQKLNQTLEVLKPFPDGAIQVIRKDEETGKVIDKSAIIQTLEIMYPGSNIENVAMFGDGHNDIPAMSPEHVIPITFNNAEEVVKEYVKSRSGYISPYSSPEDLGVIDSIKWLSDRGFFKEDQANVEQSLKELFPILDE